MDFAGVDVDEERTGGCENAMGFDEARTKEADVVVEYVGVERCGGKFFGAIAVASESSAVAGIIADGADAGALLGGASVEWRINVDELDT